MKDLGFGLTMTIAGMGVTLVTLYILTLVIQLLIKLFPHAEEVKAKPELKAEKIQPQVKKI